MVRGLAEVGGAHPDLIAGPLHCHRGHLGQVIGSNAEVYHEPRHTYPLPPEGARSLGPRQLQETVL